MSNYKELAKNIIENVGGHNNIKDLRHCITRLRFNLYDDKVPNADKIKELDGVITVVQASGQYQVVIGNNVGDVYQEIDKQLKMDEVKEPPLVQEEKELSVINKFINFISSLFQPFLGTLTAAGMIKGVVAILGVFGLYPDTNGLTSVLNIAGDAFFQFLPIMLAVTASRALNLKRFNGLTIAAALLYPTLDLLGSGDVLYTIFEGTMFQSDIYQTFLGVPIILPPGGYLTTIIPIIIAIWFASRVEAFAEKIVPSSLQTFFVPFIVLLISIPISILIIGPMATWGADLVGIFFMGLYEFNTVIFGALVGGLWQVLVMLGLHWGLIPIAIMQVVEQGYSPIFGASDVAWAAVMGVLLAIFIKAKATKTKQLALPATISSFFGITEPGVYGFLIQEKKLFINAIIASAIGGAYSGFFDVFPYRMGGLGIFTLPSYIPDSGVITMNIWHRVISYTITFVIAFTLTVLHQRNIEKTVD